MKIQFTKDIFGDQNMADEKSMRSNLPAGTAQWTSEEPAAMSLIFICPCGCKAIRSVPVKGPQKWNWDGNRELPTLTPSILIVGECGWHGFLTGGEWRTC
jgi:hypothetical protein